MICAIVVHPDHAEGEHTLRLDDAAQQVSLLILGMLINHRGKRGEHFLNGLNKFGLIAVLLANRFDDALNIGIHVHSYSLKYFNLAGFRPGGHILSMMETISWPMRFCASFVAAPMCGVQETFGWFSRASFFAGSSA